MNAFDLAKVAEKLPLSESVRKLNLGPEARPSGAETEQQIHKERIHTHRTRKCRMNKLELRFYELLKQRYPDAHITPQFRLRISTWDAPVLVHYQADFLVSVPCYVASGPMLWSHTVYEVKDKRRKYHSNELRGPKLCRENNPWLHMAFLAEWDGSTWREDQLA